MFTASHRFLAKFTLGTALLAGGYSHAQSPQDDKDLNATSPMLRYATETYGDKAPAKVKLTALADKACVTAHCENSDGSGISPLFAVYYARNTAEIDNNRDLMAIAASADHIIKLIGQAGSLTQLQKSELETTVGLLLNDTRSSYHDASPVQDNPTPEQPVALQVQNSIARIVERDASYIENRQDLEEQRKGKPVLHHLAPSVKALATFEAAVVKILGTDEVQVNPNIQAMSQASDQLATIMEFVPDLSKHQARDLLFTGAKFTDQSADGPENACHRQLTAQQKDEDGNQQHISDIENAKLCVVSAVTGTLIEDEGFVYGIKPGPLPGIKSYEANKRIDIAADRKKVEALVKTVTQIVSKPDMMSIIGFQPAEP